MAAMFEKKATIRLDQDKGKFLTTKATEASATVINPYKKQDTGKEGTKKPLNAFELKMLEKK
jgi:hypothetical protein